MKNFILFLLAIITTISAHAQLQFVIKGELPDSLDGAQIQLSDYQDNHICGTTTLKNGRFEIKSVIERDSIRRIDVYHNDRAVNYANIIVEEGEITIDFSKNLGKGTPFNDAMSSLDYETKIKDIYYRRKAYLNNDSHTSAQIDSMENVWKDQIQEIQTEVLANHINTAKENDNALGCWAMWQLKYLLKDDPEQFLNTYYEAGPYVQNYGPLFRSKQTISNQISVRIGSRFKDIVFPTGNFDGTPAILSDFVGHGKYILLDFWASWCGPCRAETSNLKAVYEKFHGDRFNILSVAVHDSRENALQFVAEENISWPQIFEASFEDVKAYGSDGIPLIILFSPKGQILAYNVRGAGIMEAVEKALSE